MGQTKNYLLQIQQNCSEELFGQEAVEWAIYTGKVQLTGDLQTDLVTIMGEPGKPETGRYDEIIVAYQAASREHGRSLNAVYAATGFLDDILKPQPLLPPLPAAKETVRA